MCACGGHVGASNPSEDVQLVRYVLLMSSLLCRYLAGKNNDILLCRIKAPNQKLKLCVSAVC